MTQEVFKAGTQYLMDAYNYKMPESQLRVYWIELKGMEDSEFKKKVNKLIRSNQRFPTIADFYKTKKSIF